MLTNSPNKARIVFLALAIHLCVLGLTVCFFSFQVLELVGHGRMDPLRVVMLGVLTRIAAAALLIYIGIGTIKNTPGRKLTLAHLFWFCAFTWYGWLSLNAPFVLHEVVGSDMTRRAQLLQQFSLAIRFVIIAFVYSGIPLLLRRRANIEPLAESKPRFFGILRALSVVFFIVWVSLPAIVTRFFFMPLGDSVYLSLGILLGVALVSTALCAAAKQRGSLVLLLVEAWFAPFVSFFHLK